MEQGLFAAEQVQIYLLVFVRVSAMLALLPIFGSQNVPVHIKVAVTALLAFMLYPMVQGRGAVEVPLAWGMFVFSVIKELFIGIVIGFAASLLFAGVQFAGRLVDTQMGFAFVQLVDPFTSARVTTLGQLKIIVFTILFLLLNGHYFLLLAVQKSFEVIPLCGAHMPGGKTAYVLTEMTAGVFESAVKLAAPVFVTLVLTSLSMGVIARTVPQINIFFVGLPLKIFLGLGTTIVAFPALAIVFRKMVDQLMRDIWRLLYLMA